MVIADLHLHSRFSRAVSKDMTIPTMAGWAEKKGIDLLGTGDFTHPLWFRELRATLEEVNEGIFKLKGNPQNTSFMLTTELSSIYRRNDKSIRIHYLVWVPSFETVEKINNALTSRGVNLLSDGRPIMKLNAKDVCEEVLSIDDRCLVIPAHVWTPWYSLYGSKSGFDFMEECFEELSKYIYAVETGLSSDPAMNWRVGENTSRKIVSFGDAHSPRKLGREATVFDFSRQTSVFSYQDIRDALIQPMADGRKPEAKIAYTIEFYPEEGKYHYTGHRKCGVVMSPNEVRKKGMQCPVCGKPMTMGVASRVEDLGTQEAEIKTHKDKFGVTWIEDKEKERAPYVMLVPLAEILAEVYNTGTNTKTVEEGYNTLVKKFGCEFKVLLTTPLDEIGKFSGDKIMQAIEKVRNQDIYIKPGYDGEFGKVSVWKKDDKTEKNKVDQNTLF